METTCLQSGQNQLDDYEDYTPSQVVYLDFDGAETHYSNSDLGIYIENVTVHDPALTEEQIDAIASALNEQYAEKKIQFVTQHPQEEEEYSTVYVGKTDAFDAYGDFLGLAETIDIDNKVRNDNAFVLLDSASSSEEIISVISHEVGHLVEGKNHYGVSNNEEVLDDYAFAYELITQKVHPGG